MNDKITSPLDTSCHYKDHIFKTECLVLTLGTKSTHPKIQQSQEKKLDLIDLFQAFSTWL